MNASISLTGQRFDRGPRLTGCGINPSRCQRYKVASEICRRSITSFRRRSRFSIVQIVIHQDCGLRIIARREFVTWAHRPGRRLRDAGSLCSGFGPPQMAGACSSALRPTAQVSHPCANARFSRFCSITTLSNTRCGLLVEGDTRQQLRRERPQTANRLRCILLRRGLALVDKREPDRASQSPRSGRTGRDTMSDGCSAPTTAASGRPPGASASTTCPYSADWPTRSPPLRVTRAFRGSGRLVRRQRLRRLKPSPAFPSFSRTCCHSTQRSGELEPLEKSTTQVRRTGD